MEVNLEADPNLKMVQKKEATKKPPCCAKAQILATLSVSWIYLIIGYSVAYAKAADISLKQNFSWFDIQMYMVEGCLAVGAIFGVCIGGILMGTLGRKWSLLLGNFILLVSWVGFCLAKFEVNCLKFARFGIGVGCGIGSLVTPLYIAEISHPKLRGVLGMVPFVMGNVGVLCCCLLGVVLHWQDMALIAVLLCVPYFLLSFYLVPESPVWYLVRHRRKVSYKTLIGLRPPKTNNEEEFFDLEDYVNHKVKPDRQYFHYVRPLLMITTFIVFQQMTFIKPITYMFTKICVNVSFSINPRICALIVGVVNLISTFLALLLVDKLGRRILFNISVITMLMSSTIFSIYFHFKSTYDYDWILLTILLFYILGFSFGLGTIPLLLIGEILHCHRRTLTAVILTSHYWMSTCVMTKNDIQTLDIPVLYWVYLSCPSLIILLLFLNYILPETKGKSLWEVQKLLDIKRR